MPIFTFKRVVGFIALGATVPASAHPLKPETELGVEHPMHTHEETQPVSGPKLTSYTGSTGLAKGFRLDHDLLGYGHF